MDTLHRLVAARFGRVALAELIYVCLDTSALRQLAGECGDEAPNDDKQDMATRIARVAADDEGAGAAVTRALVRANYDLIREVATSDAGPGATGAALKTTGEYHPVQVDFAVLAGKPAEVNDMRDNLYEQRASTEELADLADQKLETEDVASLVEAYRHLSDELEEARAEREDILDRLDRVLELLERPDAAQPPAIPSPSQSTSSTTRVALFVDVQSVFYNARNYYSRKMDFKKLAEVARRGRELSLAVAFVVQSPDVDQTNFISMLQHNGYAVRQKAQGRQSDTVRTLEPSMEDDILAHVRDVDVVVLVGGDGEIVEIAPRIAAIGTPVELFAFEQNVPGEARAAAREFFAIDEKLLLEQEYAPRQNARNEGRSQHGASGAKGRTGVRGSSGRSRWEGAQGTRNSWLSGDV